MPRALIVRCASAVWLAGALAGSPVALGAQSPSINIVGRMYFSEVSGDSLISHGDTTENISRRAVYTAQGSVIEIGRGRAGDAPRKLHSTMVYSNGTGVFFDAETRVEVRRFAQEPFTPNRTDVEAEPSISQTQAYVSRGTIALCTSKLVAGSNMNYATPLASVTIRGRRVVIAAAADITKISLLEGDATVRAGDLDTGSHTVKAGEQAVVRRGAPGQPNPVEVRRIPEDELSALEEKAALACTARRTVYFDVGGDATGPRELVPVEIVPTTLPVDFTISPARIEAQGASATR